jgi:hypothetical protein
MRGMAAFEFGSPRPCERVWATELATALRGRTVVRHLSEFKLDVLLYRSVGRTRFYEACAVGTSALELRKRFRECECHVTPLRATADAALLKALCRMAS